MNKTAREVLDTLIANGAIPRTHWELAEKVLENAYPNSRLEHGETSIIQATPKTD